MVLLTTASLKGSFRTASSTRSSATYVPTEKSVRAPRAPPSDPTALRWFCIILHGLLVLAFVTLLGLVLRGHDNLYAADVAAGQYISKTPTIAATLIATAYLIGLIYLTQQLALRDNFLRSKNLTQIHDRAAAWYGLGAALHGLTHQARARNALHSALAIAAYLLCLAIVQVVTPLLFDTEIVWDPARLKEVPSRLVMPNTEAFQLDGENSPWASTMAMLPYLSSFGSLGIINSTVYAVLDDNNGIGMAALPAMTFNVTCGTMSVKSVMHGTVDDDGVYEVAAYGDGYNATFEVMSTYDNVLKNAEVTLEDPVLHTEATLGPDAVFYSSFNVTGLDGTDLGTSIGGNSAALKHDDQTEAYWGPPIQLIGCSLSVRNHTVIVEPQSKLPVDFDINVDKFALDWEDWEPLMVRKGNVADAWARMLLNAVPSSTECGGPCTDAYCERNYLTTFEQWVQAALDVTPVKMRGSSLRTRVQLHDLEWALSCASAAVFWAASQNKALDSSMLVTTTSDSVVASPVLISRMRLNSVALGLGAGASAAAFVLALVLVSRPALRPSADHPDSAGTLQLLWFARRRHEALAPLGRVDEPRVADLRRTGMGMAASAIAGESSNHLLRRDSARSSTLRMSTSRPQSAPRLSSVAETSDTGSIHTDVTDSVATRSTIMVERYGHDAEDRRASQMLERRASNLHVVESRTSGGLQLERRHSSHDAPPHAHYSDDPFRSAADDEPERYWRDEEDPFRAEDEDGRQYAR